MKFLGMFLLVSLTSCCGASTRARNSNQGECTKPVKAKGDVSIYKAPSVEGATVGNPLVCNVKYPAEGTLIPVYTQGAFPIDPKPRGGCWKVNDGEWKSFPNHQKASVENCRTLNLNGFLRELDARLKQAGVQTGGVGIHRCTGEGALSDPNLWRHGVTLHDWRYAAKAVEVTARFMLEWKVNGTVDVRVKDIPGRCLRSRDGEE